MKKMFRRTGGGNHSVINRRGFTLVELIIVIAVIGVLAAILIPVFSNVIAKANEKSARSDARNTVSQYVIDAVEDPTLPSDIVIMVFKAGKCYLYGYDMDTSGELLCSTRNDEPIGDAQTPADAILGYSYNVRVNNTPAPDANGTYDIATQGAFYLIIHPELRSFRGASFSTIPGTGYLSIETSESIDNVVIFHGFLLNGTYNTDSTNSGSTTSSDSGSVVTPANHTVSYNSNGGTGSMSSETVQQGSTTYALPTCTFTAPAGKHFDGWKAGNTGDAIGAGTNYTVTGDTEFYAQWTDDPTCTVSYNANGGTGTMSSDTVSQGATDYTLPANGFTAPAHKHFTGWKANNEGSLINAGTSYTVNTDTVFYAQWTDDVSYSVTYNKNAADATGSLTDNTRYYDGDTATVLANNFSREGYTFKYFTTTSADTGTHYTAGNTITINGAGVTLYAQWQINSYTVTFTDGTSSQNKTYNHGTTITLADENPLTAPSGKEFDKFTVGGADATTLTVTADTTVTVVWKNAAATPTANFTLNLKYVTMIGNPAYEVEMPVSCNKGETITFTVGYLKTHYNGANRLYIPDDTESYLFGGNINYVSITQGTQLDGNGNVQNNSGQKLYTLQYTRPSDYNATSADFIIYTFMVGDSVSDEQIYGDEWRNDPTRYPEYHLNILPTAIIPVPYEDR